MVIDYSFLMMDSSDSQCGCSDSQEPCEYQENEVVWAKIKGYPWWPAYIGQIITKRNSVALHKVYYLGYNSHSLLAFGNMRKFEPHFHDFFLASKKNQRLKDSILYAIELLKKNNEDISYFDKKILAKKKKKEPRTLGTPVKQDLKRSEQPLPNLNIVEQKIDLEKGEKRKRGRPKKIVKPQKSPQQQQNQKDVQIKLTNSKIKEQSPLSTQDKIPQIIIHQTKKPTNPLQNMADYIVSFRKQENKMGNIELQNKATKYSQNSIAENRTINKSQLQLSYQKDINIQQLNRLLINKSFKKAFTLARTLKVNTSNVLDFLNDNILAKMSHASNKKPFIRLKNRLKKALIDRYFNSKTENQFSNKNYHSHRAKIIRQIYRILKSTNTKASKNLATICEQKIYLKNRNRIDEYKEDIATLMQSLRTNQLKSFVEIELSHLSLNDQ